VALLFNAATPPAFYRTIGGTQAGNVANLVAAGYRYATNGIGLTALSSSITPSGTR
jgi:hypothetical protein